MVCGHEIRRAAHTESASVENVGVDHGGLDAAVPQQFLDGSDVVSVPKKMSRKGMPERVASGGTPFVWCLAVN